MAQSMKRGARQRQRVVDPKAGIQDWLSLVDPDGAFLTSSELTTTFPHGFEPMDKELRTELRARVAELAAEDSDRAQIRNWLLSTVLSWDEFLVDGQQIPPSGIARNHEYGVQLRPSAVLVDVDDPNKIRLGVFTWDQPVRLDRRVAQSIVSDAWPASPIQRAETWCRESGIPLALVTNDEQWVLVWAPRQGAAASCRWGLTELADERILQDGLVSLLGARRFFAVDDSESAGETLEALFSRAANAEAELTKGLGSSVRRSVELLVSAISHDDVASGGQVLRGVPTEEVYEAAVTVLMRLVFLLFAEERNLLPAEDPLWVDSYSVLSLRDQLRRQSTTEGQDALDRRSSAWQRLLATFRAIHGGVSHDRLSLPAYGGNLFDPARFPFLEGTHEDLILRSQDDDGVLSARYVARPVAIDDRTILAILDALLNVQVKAGRGTVTQRVSYKALDVEQIGHCYEGLLDHGCAPVMVLSLGLIGPEADEPEVTVDDLERHFGLGTDVLCDWLSGKTMCNKKASALSQLLEKQPSGVDLARLRSACGHDDSVVERVLPFWGLIRSDLRSLPVVLLPGSQFVTQISTRRNMGAQYTTKGLAEEVVRYALEPLVYEPGPQNETDSERWVIRRPEEILNLKICDPAVGSGAILTAGGRFLADSLVKAVGQHGPGQGPFAARMTELANAAQDEQVLLARREVVDRCLYGVDKNPVAAEMAKLSLWLTTMAKERPFTFLDHAIQVGDSLLGVTEIDQIRWLHMDPSERHGARGFEGLAIDLKLARAVEIARDIQALSIVTLRDVAFKRTLQEELEEELAALSIVADAVVGAAIRSEARSAPGFRQLLAPQMDRIRNLLNPTQPEVERHAAEVVLAEITSTWLRTDLPSELTSTWERHCFHWPLRFPEVFLDEGRVGFDAIIGNPPFLGGKRISGPNGFAYRQYLVAHLANGVAGNADLVTYFFLRACEMSRSVGLLATNTISQGDTREVGLDRLTAAGWTIHRAVKTAPWPNEAGVEVSKVWLWSDSWAGRLELDGEHVSGVTSLLEPLRRVSGNPEGLVENAGIAFQGCILATKEFIIETGEAQKLLALDARNDQVVKPYLNGADLNDDVEQRAARWVIDFADLPIEKARTYSEPFKILEERVKPEVLAKKGYPGWSARWWQFWNLRPAMRLATQMLDRILVITRVSNTVGFAFVPRDQVPSDATAVFAYDDDGHFGLLSSCFHWWWAMTHASTMRNALRYTPSDVFKTFPQPEQRGKAWDRITAAGRTFNERRSAVMEGRSIGLTKTFNLFHDLSEQDADIQELRELQVSLDLAVRDAYGWSDLDLEHHHWATAQGMRFSVSKAARDQILDRLLELNHERHAAEVGIGLGGKVKIRDGAKKSSSSSDSTQGSLL